MLVNTLLEIDVEHVRRPVVTFPKAQSVVQLASGFYRYMNMPDCIVSSGKEYIDLAVSLSNDNPGGVRDRISRKILERNSMLFEDTETSAEWHQFLLAISKAHINTDAEDENIITHQSVNDDRPA